MRKGNLIGKIFGIALVFVTIGAMSCGKGLTPREQYNIDRNF